MARRAEIVNLLWPTREDRKAAGVLTAIAATQVVLLFIITYFLADRHFMLPLDDSYIHLQYARRIAEGAPLSYTPGASPSGGMTSPLYVALLAPMQAIGIGGAKAAFLSFLFGAALWIWSAFLMFSMGRRLTDRVGGWIAAALFLTNGHLLWNYLSGMETGLFTALVLCLVVLLTDLCADGSKRRGPLLYGVLAAIPLVRPEGILLIAALMALKVVYTKGTARLSLPLLSLACAPFLLWLLTLKFMTGDWKPAGLIVKGLSGYPYWDLSQKIAHGTDTLTAIFIRFYQNGIPDPAYAIYKGYEGMPYLPMGAALLGIAGLLWAAISEFRHKRLAMGSATFLVWFVGTFSLAASLLPFIHQQRYLAPWTPLLLLGVVVFLWRLAQAFHGEKNCVYTASGTALVLLSLPSLGFWGTEYGRNSRDIYHVLRVATFGIQESPQRYALTDAGVLAFYTDHQFYDFVGLASPEFAHEVLHGEGATLEALQRLPEDQRPTHLITYREWFSKDFPLGDGVVLSGVPRTSITSGLSLQKLPILWEDAQPIGNDGATTVVDVASLTSEQENNYQFIVGHYDGDPGHWPQSLAPIAKVELADEQFLEGGRVVRRESFLFAPGADASLNGWRMQYVIGSPTDNRYGPAAQRLRFSVRSNTTGFVAFEDVVLADNNDTSLGVAELNLGKLLNEAGGTEWTITAESMSPPGAPFASYHYRIEKPLPATNQ